MTLTIAAHVCSTIIIASVAQVPDAVGLVSQAVPEAVAEPAQGWSWLMPLVIGAVLLGVSLVGTGAWFAWSKRHAARDPQELATHALATRAGLSAPELRAIEDLVACARGNSMPTGMNASTLGLIMSPHAAAELARSLPVSAMDGFDRTQLSRALGKLGAPGTLEIKPKPKAKSRPNVGTRAAGSIGSGSTGSDSTGSGAAGATPRAMPTKGQEAIAARARAVLAAINRAKEEGYFDAKVGGPEGAPGASSPDLAKPGTKAVAKSRATGPAKPRT